MKKRIETPQEQDDRGFEPYQGFVEDDEPSVQYPDTEEPQQDELFAEAADTLPDCREVNEVLQKISSTDAVTLRAAQVLVEELEDIERPHTLGRTVAATLLVTADNAEDVLESMNDAPTQNIVEEVWHILSTDEHTGKKGLSQKFSQAARRIYAAALVAETEDFRDFFQQNPDRIADMGSLDQFSDHLLHSLRHTEDFEPCLVERLVKSFNELADAAHYHTSLFVNDEGHLSSIRIQTPPRPNIHPFY